MRLPLDGVAAIADVNPDFPGSCGRCYEVRCANGLVLANDHKPLWTGEKGEGGEREERGEGRGGGRGAARRGRARPTTSFTPLRWQATISTCPTATGPCPTP